MSQYSDVRVYMRPIARDVERSDVENLFKGYGKLVEVKLMSGFGFVEFENPRDAQDAVSGESINLVRPINYLLRLLLTNAIADNKDFMGERIQVEFAKVQRRREASGRDDFRRDSRDRGDRGDRGDFGRRDIGRDRRPRRSAFRIRVSGLPSDCSWQDLKDFARRANVEVLFADVSRDRDGTGVMEFEREDDLETAMSKLSGEEVKGVPVTLKDEISDPPRERSRSPYRRSSPPRRSYGGRYGGDDDGYRRRDRSRSPRRDRDRRDRGDRYDRRDRDRGDRRGGDRDQGRDTRDDDRAPLPPPADTTVSGDWDRAEVASGDGDFPAPSAANNDSW
ncbi:hypothetical protein V1506DRAFT_550824 [Lipomyces tetrasporus]